MLGGAGAMTIKGADIGADVADNGALAGGLTREQFTRRVSPHISQVFRFCMALSGSREAAEDLLQNALVRAFTHRDTYRGEGTMAGWLCTIARNEHLELVRTAARRRGLVRSAIERFGDVFEDWFSGTPMSAPDHAAEVTEDSGALLAALQTLPEAFRSVVWLCDVEDLSYADVSAALDLPIGTVKSRHARGRVRLRDALSHTELAPTAQALRRTERAAAAPVDARAAAQEDAHESP
jgi:RNA polymerase sigma-70 factor, ECF subfamily